ncbi:unnamed protein product [Leuciscus chuanchicus]
MAQKLTVPVSTVAYTIKRHAETGKNGDRKRTGRPQSTTKSEDKFIRVSSQRNRKLTAPEITPQLNATKALPVSTSTVQRRLREAGLGHVAVKKPLLKAQNKSLKLLHYTTLNHTNLPRRAAFSKSRL